MSTLLDDGFCAKANNAKASADLGGIEPALQILSIKKIAGAPGVPDRHRVILSDGAQFMQAMLSTTLNEQVEDGTFRRNAIIKLTKWEPQTLKEQRILIIFGMEAVDYPPEKIGNPVNAGKANATVDSPAPASVASPLASTSAPVPVPVAPAVPAAARPPAPPRNEKAPPIFPIEGLNPYVNKWTLKARVTQKSEKKRWSNAKGEGQLFSVNLMDETGEIKATTFGTAVDSLYDQLEEGRVYYVTKAKVVLAKKAFSNLTNDYEITFDNRTEITECQDTSNIPNVQYNFVQLSELEEKPKDALVDVIGVVHRASDVQEITTKQGKTLSKRELTLADRSGYTCQLTLWGKQAEQWDSIDNPVTAFKGLKLGDFGGRSLSAFSSSMVAVNPDTPDAHALRGWYDSEGSKMAFKSQGSGGGGGGAGARGAQLKREEMKTLQEVRDSDLGTRDTPDYFTSRAAITNIKQENIAYPACKGDGCSKKVADTGSGWRCEKCDKTWDEPEYRYLLSFQVGDHTGQAWLQAFNEVGAEIIGMSADELIKLRDENEAEFIKTVQKAHSKMYNFSCRAKLDTFQEQSRIRYGVNKAFPLDFGSECRNLHKMMGNYAELIPARYLGA